MYYTISGDTGLEGLILSAEIEVSNLVFTQEINTSLEMCLCPFAIHFQGDHVQASFKPESLKSMLV